MKHGLTVAILAALVLGIAGGALLHVALSPESLVQVAAALSLVTEIFLRLIKMVIAPLVLSTLIAGIAHLDGAASLGRIGLRTMVGSSRVDLQACKLEYSIVSPK